MLFRSSQAEEKAPSAFRTIGEAARELGLPTHVLRFWEKKFHQVKPQKRRGGHRYYRPEDIAFLHEVRALLHERGFTIRGAQQYLKEKYRTAGGRSDREESAPSEVSAASAPALKTLLQDLMRLRTLLASAA